MRSIVWVALGGATGSVLRFLMQRLLNPISTDQFPWGTWLVNMSGCLLIGLLWAWGQKNHALSPEARFFLLAGLCGGFTTLSAFSQESLALLQAKQYLIFLSYALATILGGWCCTWAGYKLIDSLL